MKKLPKAPRLRLRKKRTPAEAPLPADAATADEAASEEVSDGFVWTTAAAERTSRLTAYVLRAGLVAGIVALVGLFLVVNRMPSTTAVPSGAGEAAGQVNERAAVASFAEDFVVTWLTATSTEQARLGEYLVTTSSQLTLPEKPWRTSGVGIAGITQTESGVWSVTVAVNVAAAKKSPTIRRYFQVPVVYDAGALVAQALPTPVAAPRMASPVQLAYVDRIATSAPVAVAAADFLKALLVTGEVTRFVSPDAVISPVLPPPYSQIQITTVHADEREAAAEEAPETGREVRVLVTAVAVADQTRQISVQYALTMRAREGRWEVASLDPAPQVAAPAEDESSTTPDQEETHP